MRNEMYDLVVIGAGPAGMMAAGTAAEKGKSVLILEKMPKPCLKLGITGKGRCNLTNLCSIKEFIKNIESGKRFMKYSLHEFSPEKLMLFFTDRGVELKVERGRRVFPESDRAMEIVGAMKDWVRDLKIPVETDVEVLGVNRGQDQDKIKTVTLLQKNRKYTIGCHNLLIATGGRSYPKTGSKGDGYKLAKELGHAITEIKPALVPLETVEDVKELKGLKLKNTNVSIWVDSKKLHEEFGELFFTEYGVDGAVILTLSNQAVKNIDKDVVLSIDLKPALSHKKLKNRLIREFSKQENFEGVLRSLMPEQLMEYCIQQLEIDREKNCEIVTADERKELRLWLKDFHFKISAARPIEEAIVTSGGVDLKEVDRQTMKSKLVNNLYFAGEVLNIDALTGGYNLQMAFSTGYIAGKSIGSQ